MKLLRPGTRPPWVIAHRGSSASRPENTEAAFDEALAADCEGIELDVQLSSDGVAFVYHDRTLSRAGGGRRYVSSAPAREIARLRIGGEPLPTLRRVLERYGARTRLLIEIKARERDRRSGVHRRLADEVGRLVRAARVERNVWFLSFDAEALQIAARRAPRARVALNLRPPRRVSPALAARIDTLAGLSLDVRSLTPAVVRAAHERKRPVFVYTCNTPRTVRRALVCGADAIMADDPLWLREAIRRWNGAA